MVDVAVMQSLVGGDEVKELLRNYGIIIVDECHHVIAVNSEMILKYANRQQLGISPMLCWLIETMTNPDKQVSPNGESVYPKGIIQC